MLPDAQNPSPDEMQFATLAPIAARSLPLRRLLNRIALAVVLLLVLVTAPVWVSALQQASRRLFPPPPYAGGLVYTITQFGALAALRSDTGATLWQSNRFDYQDVRLYGSVLLADLQPGQGLRALNPRTGQILWESHVQENAAQLHYALVETSCALNGRAYSLYYLPSALLIWDLEASDLATGKRVWSLDSQSANLHGEAIAYVSCVGQNLFALTKQQSSNDPKLAMFTLMHVDPTDGHIIWRFAPQLAAYLYPVIVTPHQLVVSAVPLIMTPVDQVSSSVFRLDLETGEIAWQLQASAKTAIFTSSTIILTGPSLVNAQNASMLNPDNLPFVAYTVDSGQTLWTLQGNYAEPPYFSIAAPDGFHTIIEADGVTALDGDQGWVGIDVRTGSLRWQQHDTHMQVGIAQSGDLLQDGHMLFITNQGGTLAALNIDNGAISWSDEDLPNQIQYLVGSDAQTLYVFTAGNNLIAFNKATGKMRWQVHIIGSIQVPTSG